MPGSHQGPVCSCHLILATSSPDSICDLPFADEKTEAQISDDVSDFGHISFSCLLTFIHVISQWILLHASPCSHRHQLLGRLLVMARFFPSPSFFTPLPPSLSFFLSPFILLHSLPHSTSFFYFSFKNYCFNLCVCLCLCMYTCACMCAGVCIRWHMCWGQKTTFKGWFSLYLWQNLLLLLQITGPWTSEQFSCLHFPFHLGSNRVTGSHCHIWLFSLL